MANLEITQRLVLQSKTVETPAHNLLRTGHGRKFHQIDEKTDQNRARYRAVPISSRGGFYGDLAPKPQSSDARYRADPESSELDSSDEWPDKKRDFVAAAPESGTDAALPISDLEVLEKNVISKAHPSDARLDPHPEPQIWTPPTHGVIKINVDGSYLQETGEAAIACICRDSRGILVDGFARTVRVSSVIQAEAQAVLQTLKFFEGREEKQMELESDNLETVKG